ncbi:MAG: shikimate dehydrogenase [Notoacmeibacter sp.]|nr:shikimate dehydrogenase [Notoacmeibacter sp.]
MASRISGKTRLIGLFGSPVSHSLSPVMQNSLFEAMGLDFVYTAFDVQPDRVSQAVDAIRTLGMRGANITMPLKRAIMPHLDDLTPAAELARSVNVVVNDNGRLLGHVTDGEGFFLSLDEAGVDHAGCRMVILGSGGAGMTVAVQAAMAGVADVTLFNRNDPFFATASQMVADIRQRLGCAMALHDLDDHAALVAALEGADILVNATPVGMSDTISNMALPDAELLRPDLIVCDLIYVPRETFLLRQAARRGCKTVSGIGMQLFQALPAFKMRTGRDMDIRVARQALFGGDAA